MAKKPQPIPPGMERPPGLPTSPPPQSMEWPLGLPGLQPPRRVESGEYYKEMIQRFANWLASQEAAAEAAEDKASKEGQTTSQEKYHAGEASMAFRAGAWIRENIKGIK
jgi:hypothetical protein